MKRIILLTLIIFALAICCFAKNIKYCSLFDSAEYDNKTISTTAILYVPPEGDERVDGGSDSFFYLKACNNKDYFAEANFWQTKNFNVLLKQLEPPVDKYAHRLFLVTFTGAFRLFYKPTLGHLSWMRAGFNVERIESIKPIKSGYVLPDNDAEPPILDTGESLAWTNAKYMFYLVTNVSGRDSDISYLFDNKTKIIFNRKLMDKDQISQLLTDTWKGGRFNSKITKVMVNKNGWRAQGKLENQIDRKIVRQINYDNTFILQKDGNWKLINSKLAEVQPLEK